MRRSAARSKTPLGAVQALRTGLHQFGLALAAALLGDVRSTLQPRQIPGICRSWRGGIRHLTEVCRRMPEGRSRGRRAARAAGLPGLVDGARNSQTGLQFSFATSQEQRSRFRRHSLTGSGSWNGQGGCKWVIDCFQADSPQYSYKGSPAFAEGRLRWIPVKTNRPARNDQMHLYVAGVQSCAVAAGQGHG